MTRNPGISSQVNAEGERTLQRTDPPVDDAQSDVEGEVRWFSDTKGYGFITPDDGHDDVFVRQSSILRDGFRSLEAGQRVRFRRTSDQRGPRATEVRVI